MCKQGGNGAGWPAAAARVPQSQDKGGLTRVLEEHVPQGEPLRKAGNALSARPFAYDLPTILDYYYQN